MPSGAIKIALFCPGLGLGGSERQLVNLAKGLKARGHLVQVLVLYDGEPMEAELSRAGIPVMNLDKKGWGGAIVALFRLNKLLKRNRIDVLYSFHGLPNLLSAAIGLLDKRVKIVLGVRTTHVDMSGRSWMHRLAYKTEAKLARHADLVIANSHAGRVAALERGFPGTKVRVVPNGIDTNAFAPDRQSGLRLRNELNIGAGVPLVGMAARIDPMKDHRTFFQAAAVVLTVSPAVRFLCVWDGDPAGQGRLAQEAKHGVGHALIWVQGKSSMPRFYNAMDVVVSSSSGEGFQNTIGEAMACGRFCVVTNVGDAAKLVDGIGIVVPPGDAVKLANGILQALGQLPHEEYFAAARERIVSSYSVDVMVENTLNKLAPLFGDSHVEFETN